MRQPAWPGEDEPEPAQGAPGGDGPAAAESLFKLDDLHLDLEKLRSGLGELSTRLRSRADKLSTESQSRADELRSRTDKLSTDWQSHAGELRSRADKLSTDWQSRVDALRTRVAEFEKAAGEEPERGLMLRWGKPRPGDLGPTRHRLWVSLGPSGPVAPGLWIAVTALLLALAVIGAAAAGLAGVGLPLLDAMLCRARVLADRQRGRLPSPAIPSPYRPLPPRLIPRLAAMAREPVTWRDLAWLLGFGVTGTAYAILLILGWAVATVWMLASALVAFTDLRLSFQDRVVTGQPAAWRLAGLGLLAALGILIIQRLFPRIEARMSRALLAPPLLRRVQQLTATRADAVDMQAAELARIERDLHDGAQARIVALALNLGLAEQLIVQDPEAAQILVAEARSAAGTALGELRDVIRGIHPPMLADRGLAGGIEALALACVIPVDLKVDLPRRPPPALESALYFTAAELLTNSARHASASRIELTVSFGHRSIGLCVEDDGRGGAVAHAGGGLDGLRRRLAAFDGQLLIDSPPGRGTRIEVMVPCAP